MPTRKFKIARLMLLFILIGASLCGCWGQRELSDINLVYILGIDAAANGDIKVSVLVSVPIGGVVSTAPKSSVWLGSATGTSLPDAMSNLNSTANKSLTWYHTRIIIVGEAAARNGLDQLADFVARDREMRLTEKILITDGEAFDLFSVPADVLDSLPHEIEGKIENAPEWSKSYIPTMKDFLSAVAQKNSASLAGSIGYKTTADRSSSTNRHEIKKETLLDKEFGQTIIEGCSVIKEDRFVGFLNGDETRGCLWIANETYKGTISVKKDGQILALHHRRAKATIEPLVIGNKISIRINLVVRGMIEEKTDNNEVINTLEADAMEHIWEEKIKEEMHAAVYRLQNEYNADALDFGSYIKRKYPKEWKKIEQSWQSIFKSVEVVYAVDVKLRRLGTSSKAIVEKKK